MPCLPVPCRLRLSPSPWLRPSKSPSSSGRQQRKVSLIPSSCGSSGGGCGVFPAFKCLFPSPPTFPGFSDSPVNPASFWLCSFPAEGPEVPQSPSTAGIFAFIFHEMIKAPRGGLVELSPSLLPKSWQAVMGFPSFAEKEKRERSILEAEGTSSPGSEAPARPVTREPPQQGCAGAWGRPEGWGIPLKRAGNSLKDFP